MILVFPNFETLKVAITSATLPESILRAPAESGVVDELIYVQSAEKLSRSAANDLKLLGIKAARKSPVKLTNKVICWHQLIPVQRMVEAEEVTDRTPVLFATNHEDQLVNLVSEMMRLGNDRQSFRYLESGKESTTLLRVVGPPYYSLLSVIEPETVSAKNGSAKSGSSQAAAFVERSPRVWIQFGYRHPNEDQILAPVGQHILISPEGWKFIDEAPYNDVYKSMDINLPSIPNQLADKNLPNQIKILLQLTAGGTDVSEFWVLHEKAVEQVEQLIERSDDLLISRLSFAVSGDGDDTVIVIRLRPSKLPPPVLVLDGISFRSYLKLPNLFLPVGKRLHPPLRRDAVSNLLASDSQMITWLFPQPMEEGKKTLSFQVQQIADSAFQPLSNWIDYVMDRDVQSLEAWSNSFSFEFEPFICKEDKPKKPKPPRKRNIRDDSSEDVSTGLPSVDKTVQGKKDELETGEAEQATQISFDAVGDVQVQPSELQVKLNAAEQEFSELDDPVDGKERREIWMKMAPLNAGLKRRHDATICWSNAFWDINDDNPYDQWLSSELECSEVPNANPASLKKLFKIKSNRPIDGSLIAAYLAWAAHQPEPLKFVTENLGELNQFLQQQEQFMPVRTAWIAWYSLYQLSDGDVLSLARARDRMLERLYQSGLTPEFDMPSFLRAKGVGSDDRFRVLGQQIINLAESVDDWIQEPELTNESPQTRQYAQLIFAFGLARLGEAASCKTMAMDAVDALTGTENPVHTWLAKAFQERITRTLNAESQQGTLSESLLNEVEEMARLDGYIINRLRSQSRILEPVERIDAFVRWHRRYTDELEKHLTELTESTDREYMQAEFGALLTKFGPKDKNHGRVIGAALQVAPKMSEQFATQLVSSVIDTFTKKPIDPIDKAMLLQKALFSSAHFGRVDEVQSLVLEFEKSLPVIVDNYLKIQIANDKEKAVAVEQLFTESFQGLRKLGMRDEIGRIYGNISSLVLAQTKAKKKSRKKVQQAGKDATRPLRLLSWVAGGWYYFGQYNEANEIVDQVRQVLLSSEMETSEKKNLACAYVNAVAMAPPEQAKGRIEEIFELDDKGMPRLSDMTDKMSTKSHFQIFQLDVIESTLLALVNDEYSLNAESRRWLDEDEFIVRSRIHRDVQQATN